MALPTKAQILTGEYSFDGSPYMNTVSKSSINPSQFEYSFDGSPWWGISDSEISLGNKIWTSIKKIGGKIISTVKKIGGVEP